ncbi:hypothetical protein B9N62_05525 [Campylobacter concisus]|uniref:DUF4868 domain-containing protein n=1 Tax=Campylobacter concisus TaxID=199 RepID=A0A1Y5N0Q1_9BACT|nr:hypothetical protein [Campylobacter concisus]OUT11452.1 hypothetical protein B9N62_05525 [Campylobacter concisus]
MESIMAFNSKNAYKLEMQQNNLDSMRANNQNFFDISLPKSDCISFLENILYKLEDGEWFYISYSGSEVIEEITKSFNNYLNLESLNKEYMKKVKFFMYSDENIINVQRVYNSAILKATSLLKFFNNSIGYEFYNDVVEIRNERDLIIDVLNKIVYFRKFEILTSLDKKFIDYYREATDEEVKVFKENLEDKIPLFSISGDFKIGSRNSKKIKFILDNELLESFVRKDKELKKYINKFPIILKDFKVNSRFNTLFADNDTKLKHIVNIIHECYTITEITKKTRVNNSYKELK